MCTSHEPHTYVFLMMTTEGGDMLAEKAIEEPPKEAAVGEEKVELKGDKNGAVKEEGAKEGENESGVEGVAVERENAGNEGEEAEVVEEAVERATKQKRTVRKFIKKEVLEGEQLDGEQGEDQGEWILEEMSEESLQGEGILDKEPSLLGEGYEEEVFEDEKVHEFGEEQHLEEELEEEIKEAEKDAEMVEEEYQYVEEVIDPAAPFNFCDSDEALKKPFQLKPDQLAEVEQLWQLFQDHTPAYNNLDGFITPKELVYMLKSIMLMTYTEEQMFELIDFCVRPPHPKGHINFDQFVKIVTLRKRDFPLEDELRACLEIMDPEKTGMVDREYLKEVVGTMGYKMPSKMLENLIKEVDMSNDGTIGIDDVIGTIMMDLNRDDINMLKTLIYPDEEPVIGEAEEGNDFE